jgi:HK97 family phage major capsid protein
MKTQTRRYSPGVTEKLRALGYDPVDVRRAFADAARGGTATTEPDELTIPDTPAQLEDMLQDPKKMKALFSQKDGFATFVRAYAKNVLDKDQEIATQVREETQRVLADWLRENREDGTTPVNLNVNPADLVSTWGPHGQAARNALYNPKAMGAAIDKEFKNSGEYFQTIWHNTNRDASLQAKLSRIRNAFSSTVPSEGGFLIPETLRSQLLSVALETAIVRPRAFIVPMETLRVPFPAIDSTSNVSSVFGGIVAFWTEEGAQLQESQASFGRVVLDAKKLTALAHVPNELISDSLISFQAFIDQKFPEAITWYEDIGFLTGTGVGEPLGVLNGNAAVTETRSAGDLFSDVIAMYARMLPSSLGRAVWVASIDAFPSLASMALTRGTDGIASPAVWLNNGQLIEGPPMTILGRPVVFTEKVPQFTATGGLSFIDFGYYLVGDRQVMSALSSPHFKFDTDQTSFRIIQRVDGRPWLNSAITPKNGSATLSPIVKLAA